MKLTCFKFSVLVALFSLPVFFSYTVNAELILGMPALMFFWWADALIITALVAFWSYKDE